MIDPKKIFRLLLALSLLLIGLFSAARAQTHAPIMKLPTTIALPKGAQGINFDDLRYFSQLHRIAVPAAQTGDLDLINPINNKITVFPGVAGKLAAPNGDDQGATSVAYGNGILFAGNHARVSVALVDPNTKQVINRYKLAGDYDFLRYIASRHELWVTELGKHQIEILKLSDKQTPALHHETFIKVPGGPEGLVFDKARNRAYTNLRTNHTLAISLSGHRVVSSWSNSCKQSRGLVHYGRFLFVGCNDGTAVTLSIKHHGKIISKISTKSSGVDLIAYNQKYRHLYIPGARNATMTVLRVSRNGQLHYSSVYHTSPDAHCVAAVPSGKVFVCDPKRGSILMINDNGSNHHSP